MLLIEYDKNGGHEIMEYILDSSDENKKVIRIKDKPNIVIKFTEEDNASGINTVVESLLNTFEKRMEITLDK